MGCGKNTHILHSFAANGHQFHVRSYFTIQFAALRQIMYAGADSEVTNFVVIVTPNDRAATLMSHVADVYSSSILNHLHAGQCGTQRQESRVLRFSGLSMVV